jgi:hypothetical protein
MWKIERTPIESSTAPWRKHALSPKNMQRRTRRPGVVNDLCPQLTPFSRLWSLLFRSEGLETTERWPENVGEEPPHISTMTGTPSIAILEIYYF